MEVDKKIVDLVDSVMTVFIKTIAEQYPECLEYKTENNEILLTFKPCNQKIKVNGDFISKYKNNLKKENFEIEQLKEIIDMLCCVDLVINKEICNADINNLTKEQEQLFYSTIAELMVYKFNYLQDNEGESDDE